MKIKGISLTEKTLDIISFEKMLEMAKCYSTGEQITVLVPQGQICSDKHHNVTTRCFEKIYRATSDKRRVSSNNTVPFGFKGPIPGVNANK